MVYGQLRHYARSAGLEEAWLVVEDFGRFAGPLREAGRYLERAGLARVAEEAVAEGVGFVLFRYRKDAP